MTDKVALITGGARGIGRAVALDLARRGWSIAICYRTSVKEASEVIDAVKAQGVDGSALQCDVSDPKAAVEWIHQINKQWGRIDALINSAGPYHRVSLLDESNEGWHSMFDNNLHPVFYLSQAVVPIMKEKKWGRIICFSMANAEQLVAQPQLTAHYITKVGLLVLARSLARLVAPHGITVNAISPGFIDSGSAPKQELEAAAKRIPAGYVGNVEDAAAAVRFLLSDEARYVNGANIQLSGAWGV
ncbi:MAG TPA: SDR family oxidoreductase [Candidatus Udaeobacter sp.]|jgi:3-oxoacyl-[acyl-carrier protein] reductase|nr:SDR family oxidoreductase [Candidatus Udaeobacter sp.]